MGTLTATSKLMSFRLPRDVADQLQQYADASGQSMASIVTAALQRHFRGAAAQLIIIDDVGQLPGQISAEEILREGGQEE